MLGFVVRLTIVFPLVVERNPHSPSLYISYPFSTRLDVVLETVKTLCAI